MKARDPFSSSQVHRKLDHSQGAREAFPNSHSFHSNGNTRQGTFKTTVQTQPVSSQISASQIRHFSALKTSLYPKHAAPVPLGPPPKPLVSLPQVQPPQPQILAPLPPVPPPHAVPLITSQKSPQKSPRKSPRKTFHKSPIKQSSVCLSPLFSLDVKAIF